MRGYNKVILMGNLTRDPELKFIPSGKAVAKIGLAVSRSWKDEKTGEMREDVVFVDVEAWGKPAEIIAQYCKKGSPLFVEGRLKLDSWEDKNTKEKRSKMGVVLENFQLLGDGQGRNEGGAEAPSAGAYRAPARPAAAPSVAAEPDTGGGGGEDDDVPF